MAIYYMQVAIVKEFVIEAYDELQAERGVFAAAGNDQHNIIGMKCYGVADEYDESGALTGDAIADMAELKTFSAVDPEWIESPQVG